MLFGAARETLGQHGNLVDRLCIVPDTLRGFAIRRDSVAITKEAQDLVMTEFGARFHV